MFVPNAMVEVVEDATTKVAKIRTKGGIHVGKAVYYGQVELIPDIICDDYVLDDGTATMSILAVADLLFMHHRALQNIATNGVPKSLQSFWNKGLNIATKTVLVVASNSHYKNRYVEVCDSNTIESLMRAYAFAFASDQLRERQKHIGKRYVFLMGALVRTALDAAIKEACGFIPNIQKTAQKHYVDAVELIQELGFSCSIPNGIAIKQDIAVFLRIPESTLNNGILQAKSRKVIRLYDLKDIPRESPVSLN